MRINLLGNFIHKTKVEVIQNLAISLDQDMLGDIRGCDHRVTLPSKGTRIETR